MTNDFIQKYRTHESVLLDNYPVTICNEQGMNWHATKYELSGKELMERRCVIIKCSDGSLNIHNQYNALGSFHTSESINLNPEQIAFIKGVL